MNSVSVQVTNTVRIRMEATIKAVPRVTAKLPRPMYWRAPMRRVCAIAEEPSGKFL